MEIQEITQHISESNNAMRAASTAMRLAQIELDSRQASLDAACNRIQKLERVLRQIVDEYDNTYDADCDGGIWTSAASIPAEVMERARDMLK